MDLESLYEKELNAIEDDYCEGRLSEKQYNDELKALDLDYHSMIEEEAAMAYENVMESYYG